MFISSAGPLSYADKTTGRMVLWGVVHAGPPECAEKGKYGVYVEVVIGFGIIRQNWPTVNQLIFGGMGGLSRLTSN